MSTFIPRTDHSQPALTGPDEPHTPRFSRPRRRAAWIVCGTFVLAALAFAGAALAPDGGSRHPFSVIGIAGKSTPNPLAGRLSKVYGTDVPASRFGTEVADLEDEGTNLAGEQISDLQPLSPGRFSAPENEYRHYAQRWISAAVRDTEALRGALAGGDRPLAQSAWERTWSDYLHLGAVYGLFGDLNQAIDGTAGGLPGGTSDPRFTGLHRIEMGLWTGAPPRSLLALSAKLADDLRRLRRMVPKLQITPLEYATRSHEIIEDAQRDFLSGVDVPWSGQGVLGAAAALAATTEVFHTLLALLDGRDNTEGEVRAELKMLGGVLAEIRRRHHGRYPSLSQLGTQERERLNGYVAGALSALKQMPGTLETEAHHAIPKLAPTR